MAEMPYEMDQLETLLDIEPLDDLDMKEHISSVIQTVEEPPIPVARRGLI